MCDFEKGIKLCSCDQGSIQFRGVRTYVKRNGELVEFVSKKDAKIPLEYIWSLFRYDGRNDDRIMGRYLLPSRDLGKGLNAPWIAQQLNRQNCFDFEYQPSEGDNLKIHENVRLSPYLSFVFRKGEWVEGNHDPFEVDTTFLREGRIQPAQDEA